MSEGYAGDLTPKAAWDLLSSDQAAQLIDVRSDAEFKLVGVLDLSEIAKEAHEVSWRIFPGMTENPDFTNEVARISSDKNSPLLFVCRSGSRSVSAAVHMTSLGYSRCYNILGGFEGGKDAEQHRGTVDGWKADGLPWKQY